MTRMVTSGSATLRTVDRSRPQLVHTPSKQSIAASSDYYSLSDATINSKQDKPRIVRYHTPPSRNISSETMVRRTSADRAAGKSNAQAARSAQQPTRAETATPTPGVDDTPYIRFAIDQLTRDEEIQGQGRRGTVASTGDYATRETKPEDGLGYYTQAEKIDEEDCADNAFRVDPNDVLIAVDPPKDGYRYNPLDAVPLALHPLLLAPLIILCICMTAALIYCGVWSQKHQWFLKYDYFGGSKYFVFKFLPQLLAAIIITCVLTVQAAVYRVAPLSILSRTNTRFRVLQKLPMLPRNFLVPDFSHFRHGELVICLCLCVIWATNLFAIPLQSCLFVPKWYGDGEEVGFKWTAARPIVWILVGLYTLLTVALTIILIRFNLRTSGLLWDPVCLADIIPLIQKSNILHDYHQTEIADRVEENLRPRPIRLGYWKTSASSDVFYGLGEENAPLNRVPDLNDSQSEKTEPKELASEDADIERQQLNNKNSFERDLHSPYIRFSWAPWFLRDTFIVAWIVIALVLLVAFITVSFVNRGIRNGFVPLLPTLASHYGFSPSNFLYSFIPALIGTVLFLLWQPFDVYFRSIQPFSALSSPDGASAESSILLSYNSLLPIEVTLVALGNRHYKVAYVSLVGLFSLAIPVLAGGLFMAQWYAVHNQVRISAYSPAFYVLVALVIVYALSFVAIWPRRRRYLPHSISTYADIISFLYQSPLLLDKIFREPKTKTDLVTRTLIPPPGEGNTALYAFGIYHGLDGKEHLGIDRLRRPERGEMLVSPPPGGRHFSL